MDLNLMDFEENFKGPVLVTCTGAERGKTTRTGTEYLRLNLRVEQPTENYNLDDFKDPTGYELTDTLWLPMESDKTNPDKGEKTYRGKGVTLLKAVTGFGFDGTELPEAEAFQGLTAYCDLMIDKESGDPAVRYRSYKAV